MMRIAEEILLLLLNEDNGYFEPIPSWNLSCVFAGAVLADLALENRIDTDFDSLKLIDAKATGDDLLDPALAEIALESETRSTQYCVERTARRSESVIESALEGLVGQGVLEHDQAGYWSLSRIVARSRKYPSKDGTARSEVRSRILKTLFEDEIPDPRDTILIGLARTCDALHHLMPIEDFEEVKARIDLISKMDLISRSIAEAVRGICLQPPPMRFAASKEIPILGIWDVLRNKKARRHLSWGNISKLMAEIYRAHGSVVELKLPFRKQKVVALIGRSTNNWFHKQGRLYLRSREYIQGLERLFGASRTLPGMDGAEHFRLRKSLNRGYSRASLEGKLDTLFAECRASLHDWMPGDSFRGTSACQTLMSRQVSQLALSVASAEEIHDVLDYERRAVAVRSLQLLPEFMLRTPAMKKKRRRLMELLGKIQVEHTQGLRKHQDADLVDEFLRIHEEDPQFLPQTDLNFYFLNTLFTSIFLGNALAFAIATMTSHPEVYEKIKAEGDGLFGKGDPRPQDLISEAMDTASRLIMETQRMFPVIPMQMRDVMNPCIIEGHEIPVGTRLVNAQTSTHFLEEHFSNPLQFDIDRFQSGRAEKQKPGVYAPFGLGTHKCLGSRWADLQMVVNILLIAHHLDLKSSPSSYDLRINPVPISAPNKAFTITVKAVRNRLSALAN